MKRIISLTLTALTVVCAQAMEQQPLDAQAELTALIISCDATTFATSWKALQETASADELTVIHTQLIQLATQLKTHKEQSRTQKLNNMKSRVLAGIFGVPTAILSLLCTITLGYAYLRDLYIKARTDWTDKVG